MKRLLIVLVYFVMCQAVYAQPPCTLQAGWVDWRPYQFEDKHLNLVGLDVELLNAVAGILGCDVSWAKQPWERLLLSVQGGSLDVMAGVSSTAERNIFGRYSKPYRLEERVLFILSKSAKKYNFTSLQDISNSNFLVGINRGAFNGDKFSSLMKNPDFKDRVQVVSNEIQNFDKLLLGNRIDGFITDKVSGVKILNKNKLNSVIKIHPMHIYATKIHYLFSKKTVNSEFVNKFNQALSEYLNSEDYKIINEKYLR